MKKANLILIFLMGLLSAACSDSNGGREEPDYPDGSKYILSGSVVMNGEPVNAAAVLLTPGGGTYLTGSDGNFIFNEVAGGSYEIKVYKEGCQPFNKSLTINKDYQDMALTITENTGNLHLNKGYIDMGSNASNNLGAFTITNNGESELTWQATSGARWITKIEPAQGTIPKGGSAAVSFTINRDRFSQETLDNHTAIVVRSTTAGDGSLGELLVTAFGQGNGTNVENDNSDVDYVMIGDLYVQTVDIATNITKPAAELLCDNSVKGGYDDWRLPTLQELATLYENRTIIGGFESDYYWASDLTIAADYPFCMIYFRTGDAYSSTTKGKCYARAVRKAPVDHLPVVNTLAPTQGSENTVILHGKIIDNGLPEYTERGFIVSNQPAPTFNNGTKYIVDGLTSSEFYYAFDDVQFGKKHYYRAYASNSLGTVYGEPTWFRLQHTLYVYIPELNLMVQRQDLGRTSYDSAVSLTKQSRIGGFSDWRLPTIDELVAINNYLESYPLTFNDNYSYSSSYWSSTVDTGGLHYVFNFYYNRTETAKGSADIYVRAVRTANE